MNHTFLGGSFFIRTIEEVTKGTFPGLVSPKFPIYVREYYTLKFILMYWLPKTISRCWQPIHREGLKISDKEPKRYHYKFDIKSVLQSYPKAKTKTVIIYHALQKIINSVNNGNQLLKVYLTFAFEHDTRIHNNVGIIFIDFYKTCTLKQLEHQIQSQKYQVIATNNLMTLINSGKKARNSVDVVLTMSFVTHVHVPIPICSGSFAHVADYPIYLLIGSIGDICHVSTTVMTDDINYDMLLTSSPNPIPIML
jgi:hypothetical protein